MNMYARYAALAAFLLALAGCAQQQPPQQVNMEDYMFQTAISDCREKTWDMLRDSSQAYRASYFKYCMDKYGYDQKSYHSLWIDALN